MSENEELTSKYSEALDEIWALRALMAYEARVRDADLELKSFPKSRREIAEQAVERMRRCAAGEALEVNREFGEAMGGRARRELLALGLLRR